MFRAIQVTRYIKALEQHYGIDAPTLLEGSGIDVAELANPDVLISLYQYARVVANMYRLTDDSGVAFTVARSMNISDFGLVGYAMLSARTWRDSIEIWIKYSNSLVGQYIQTSWGGGRDGHELSFHSPVDTGMLHRFETEQAIVGGCLVVRDLTGVEPVFQSIDFSYAEPSHRALYERFMMCPLKFNAPKTVVRFVSPEFDAPVKGTNAEIFALCAENCSKVMTLMPGANPLLRQLRELFLGRSGCLPDLEEAGNRLDMSPSTLLRKLEASGYSYQQVKDEFRSDLAREYLRSGHMAPKQVSYLLGFSSPSNFRRAFKSWTGMTVGAFLKEGFK